MCKSGDLGVGTPRPPVEARGAAVLSRIIREETSRLRAAPQTPLHILVVFTSWHMHCIHLVAAG